MEPENDKISESSIKKIFISYCWSNNDYVDKVRELAEELADNAMEVELDQWSLKEGDDKFVYMEQMVNDPTIDKVIVLLDKKYKEKADDRKGGVGTETTIMTPQIYADVVEKRGKQKFIPVIMERDEDTGEEFVPAFLKGRKYIDLTDVNHYSERFEELVRAIHNKPIYQKPAPGKVPSYLLESEGATLASSGRARRAIEFLVNDKPQSLSAVKDYFSYITENLHVFDFPENTKEIQFSEIPEKLKEILPLRDEMIDVIVAIAKYKKDSAFYEEIHNFFEQIFPFFDYRNNQVQIECAADHYKFFGNELFLYTVATLLKHQRFEQLNELTEQRYYKAGTAYDPDKSSLMTFCCFDTYSDALRRLHSRGWGRDEDIEARYIKQRAVRKDIKPDDLAQADFILYLLYHHDKKDDSWGYSWFPKLLVNSYKYTAFELFLRSQSLRFFDKFRVCLRSVSKNELEELLKKIDQSRTNGSSSSLLSLKGLELLTGINEIATGP